MTETRDVDWGEVERRGRRNNWFALFAVPAFLGAVVALTGRYAFWEGGKAWLVVAAFFAFGLAMQALNAVTPRLRARSGQAFRIQYALRHRVDPGPDLRDKADRYARRMAGMGWMAWFFPFAPVGFLIQGRWDHPLLAVPATVVLGGCVLALVLWWRRQTAAARRWVDDLPGPGREIPPLGRWERWMTGRRLMCIILAVVGFAAAIPLVTLWILRG
jgi:hypothetical protein